MSVAGKLCNFVNLNTACLLIVGLVYLAGVVSDYAINVVRHDNIVNLVGSLLNFSTSLD